MTRVGSQHRRKKEYHPQDGERPALFLIFVLFYVFFLVLLHIFVLFYVWLVLCRSLYFLCVYMCTELSPPGGYPIAVKYIISYQLHTFIALTKYV
jgi:hypothetical protein